MRVRALPCSGAQASAGAGDDRLHAVVGFAGARGDSVASRRARRAVTADQGAGQPDCLVQKCMPPALQQIQPAFVHGVVSQDT